MNLDFVAAIVVLKGGAPMQIQALHVRGYRSIKRASIKNCGGMNVLIGKNNAGKSTFLSAISRMMTHLKGDSVVARLSTTRLATEFTDGQIGTPFQIGVQFEFPPSLNEELRRLLKVEAPHLDKSIDQILSTSSLSFILTGIAADRDLGFSLMQTIAIGELVDSNENLTTSGFSLFSIPLPVGRELYRNSQEAQAFTKDADAVKQVLANRDRLGFFFRENAERRGMMAEYLLDGSTVPRGLRSKINEIASASDSLERFTKELSDYQSLLYTEAENLRARETSLPMDAFTGPLKTIPKYATWLMQQYGATPVQFFHERKRPIGRDEANSLLQLKVSRGGSQRLASVQSTVQALLGVRLDAFQAIGASPADENRAEMDVDEFLVEANGAGIREALRIVLDLELKHPQLVLLEEPEVHLHPGLERALESYLRGKSAEPTTQLFLTTHSTSFIDGASFQNVYLVSRDSEKRTTCGTVDASGALRIPNELGLRLSTVFMFDRLVFVEGPTDEAVLRSFASLLGLDLARANVGFVQMGGVRNFAHYAAEATLDLLSQRQVRVWFVTDRDERDDDEVRSMIARMRGGAQLVVLRRREIENYLLDAAAFTRFINRKLSKKKNGERVTVTVEQVATSIRSAAESLKDEVIRLRRSRIALRPVFLERRDFSGSVEDRIIQAIKDLTARQAQLPKMEQTIVNEIEGTWPASAVEIAPGSAILEKAAESLGARFSKASGDSIELAQALEGSSSIPEEIAILLKQICAP